MRSSSQGHKLGDRSDGHRASRSIDRPAGLVWFTYLGPEYSVVLFAPVWSCLPWCPCTPPTKTRRRRKAKNGLIIRDWFKAGVGREGGEGGR